MENRGATRVAAVVAALLSLGACGEDAADPGDAGPSTSPTSEYTFGAQVATGRPSTEEFCAEWHRFTDAQGRWVATQAQPEATELLRSIDQLRAWRPPRGMSEAAHTGMLAIVDDVHGTVDPAHEPSLTPTEPADVPADHESDEHGHGHSEDEAPFGTFLAEHCPA